MKLVSVYDVLDAPRILYGLLKERAPTESISHKSMPNEAQHMHFYLGRPYKAWYLIESELDGDYVGSVYLTKQREIGIAIYENRRRQGHGTKAIQLLMEAHPGDFLANINPANAKSLLMFKHLGFHHIQETYKFSAS